MSDVEGRGHANWCVSHGLCTNIYIFASKSRQPLYNGAVPMLRSSTVLFVNVQEKIYTSTQPHATNTEVVADDLLDTISSCAICLMSTNVTISSSLSLDGWAEEYSMDLLLYNGQRYHAPCANFWRHFVSEDLPTLG